MPKMLCSIIKNMFSKPATRKYPYDKREPFKNARGCIDVDISQCVLCGICQKKCPSNAITIDKNEKSWQVNPYKCIICNACVEACPKKCIMSNENYNAPQYEKSANKKVKE